MPVRSCVLATNEIYHIYNKGVASMPIFKTKHNYQRLVNLLDFYRYNNLSLKFSEYYNKPKKYKIEMNRKLSKLPIIVDVLAYCFMPNHFHLLVRQMENDGIQKYLQKVQNAYARYYNLKFNRKGPLFQSRFKSKWVENDEMLLHVSRYIHLNPCTSYLVELEQLHKYQWSSYPYSVGEKNESFVNKYFVLKIVGSEKRYRQFVEDQHQYQRRLMKHTDM